MIFMLTSKVKQAQALAEMEFNERLNSKQHEIEDLRKEKAELDLRLQALNLALNKEIDLRSSAVERANRIPFLESDLKDKTEELQYLTNQVSYLTVTHKELETQLKDERKSAQEKLALLQESTDKLHQSAFKSLSSEALTANQQSFLQLAQSTLEKLLEQARIDFERYQRDGDNIVSLTLFCLMNALSNLPKVATTHQLIKLTPEEPQFTCYYCNNHFPKTEQIEISGYLYCEEHANRGHSTRTN